MLALSRDGRLIVLGSCEELTADDDPDDADDGDYYSNYQPTLHFFTFQYSPVLKTGIV